MCDYPTFLLPSRNSVGADHTANTGWHREGASAEAVGGGTDCSQRCRCGSLCDGGGGGVCVEGEKEEEEEEGREGGGSCEIWNLEGCGVH